MSRPDPNELVAAAQAAIENAHAPYSEYRVGAALLTVDGELFTGCNVENASYGLTICAERSAIAAAVSAGKRDFAALAIAAAPATSPPYPCGACRQVLAEFAGPDFPVYVASAAAPEGFEQLTLGDLLPKVFAERGIG